MFTEFFQQIRDNFADIPLKSKLTIGFMFMVLITALILVLVWLNQPDYYVLYSGLSPDEAGRVVQYVQEQGVKYKYENNGTTILVPRNKVYDLRLQMANEGIPNDGVVGYEIFDKNNFGMTEYVQQVNYKRALEGELQRTIQQMDEVQAARVHLVMPKEALFKEDQSEPSAAVILKLKSHSKLEKQQVEGIQYLVANSVDKLDPQSVSLLDASGNLLTDENNQSANASQTSTQYNAQKKLENYLTQKAQSMLDGVLGYGKAIVRVTADLNFKQVESTQEIYDPTSQVIRSEERTQSSQTSQDTSGQSQEHLITNYEMNKTIQTVSGEVGNIKKLHIAVLIDGKYQEPTDGKSEPKYQPRNTQEMQRFERIVKAAVGFNASRGDQVEISNVQFDMTEYQDQEQEFADLQKRQFWENLLGKGLSVGLLIFFMFLLRNVIKRSKVIIGDLPLGGRVGVRSKASNKQQLRKNKQQLLDYEIEMDEEVLEKTQLNEAIKKYASENPKQATSLIRSWLVEEE